MRDVAGLVVVQGMKPTLAGVGIGILAALALGRIASSLIYGVSARDTATFIAVTLLLVLVSFAASLVPALRATRVDPLAVLREE
jgi:putative ABC transport system permease protein